MLSEQFRTAFAKISGIDIQGRPADRFRPNTINKRELITNYEEAVAAIEAVAEKQRSGLLLELERDSGVGEPLVAALAANGTAK
jgi:hypothetical protein